MYTLEHSNIKIQNNLHSHKLLRWMQADIFEETGVGAGTMSTKTSTFLDGRSLNDKQTMSKSYLM